MSRLFVYNTLLGVGSITDVGERVHQQGSLLTAQPTQLAKPFMVYTMGNNTDEGLGDPDGFQPNRQFFQVYIYDLVGDYQRIDDIIREVKDAFASAPLSGDVCGVTYLETSRDLDDPTLESGMRYVRFQLAMAR